MRKNTERAVLTALICPSCTQIDLNNPTLNIFERAKNFLTGGGGSE